MEVIMKNILKIVFMREELVHILLLAHLSICVGLWLVVCWRTAEHRLVGVGGREGGW